MKEERKRLWLEKEEKRKVTGRTLNVKEKKEWRIKSKREVKRDDGWFKEEKTKIKIQKKGKSEEQEKRKKEKKARKT